jgi:glutathione S-transferase
MTIVITAVERSPDGGKGLARDTRVRWRLRKSATLRGPPCFVQGDEGAWRFIRSGRFRPMKKATSPSSKQGRSSSISPNAMLGLLPTDANARARAITWMFAALSTVEPLILELANARLLEGSKPWSKEGLPLVEDRVGDRLSQLSARLAAPTRSMGLQRGGHDDGA